MISNITVESVLEKWRSYADIKDATKKRKARFKYLCELQELFLKCDFDLIRDIIIGLCRQCHGSEYDYSHITINEPIKFVEKIPIVCSKHGTFFIRLIDHLIPPKHTEYPIWCLGCIASLKNQQGTQRKRMSGTMFISRGELVHGSKYEYSLVKYIDTQSKVLLICQKCLVLKKQIIEDQTFGVFKQSPNRHLDGYICKTCAMRDVGEINSSADEKIIKQIYDKHGDKYICKEILPAIRPGAGRRIKYFCKKCGEDRIQKINNILNNNGCRYCSVASRALSFDKFVEKAKKIHEDKYDYIGFGHDSFGGRTIHYWCKACESEKIQRLYAHLVGKGCKRCSERGPSLSHVVDPMYVYFIKLIMYNDYEEIIDIAYKIGCTRTGVDKRFRNGMLPKNISYSVIYSKLFTPGNKAYTIEQEVVTKFFKHTYSGPIVLKSGGNELFSKDVAVDILVYINELEKSV